MPLVRKPSVAATAGVPDAGQVLQALRSADADERWAAARAAGALPGAVAAIAEALRVESEPAVREALFTSLARAGTPESATALVGFIRSDQAALRTGAVDALRAMGSVLRDLLPHLLADADADVRILSCELARGLCADDATRLLGELIARDCEINVCAAAIDVLAEVGTPAAGAYLARCAARFAQDPFLGFAIRIATDRISSQSARTRD